MKEYKISELMENYTDNELFLEGEQTVDTEKAVSDLLGQVKPKKRIKPLFKVIAAAAAAVVLAGAATATTFVISNQFTTPTNLTITNAEDFRDVGMDFKDWGPPMKVEEGNRLIFTAGGEDIDITDLVGESTPYIYTYVNTNGDTCYVVVGGAAGDYGFVDLFPYGSEGEWASDGANSMTPKDQWVEIEDGTQFESEEALQEAIEEAKASGYKPWFVTAVKELGLWDVTNGHGEWLYDPVDFNESLGYVYSSESDENSEQ